jgi:hypothetical protein
MTMLRNLTAHPVTIVGEGDSIVLPASSSPPRIADEVVRSSSVVVGQLDVPVRDIAAGNVLGLPEPCDDVLFVVARIVAAACPDRPDLVVPFEDVRDHAGRVIGCRALARLVPDGR